MSIASRAAYRKKTEADRKGRIYHFRGDDFMGAAAKADAERLLAEVPADTRGTTAKLAGDPIFERSALFQKQQGATK